MKICWLLSFKNLFINFIIRICLMFKKKIGKEYILIKLKIYMIRIYVNLIINYWIIY